MKVSIVKGGGMVRGKGGRLTRSMSITVLKAFSERPLMGAKLRASGLVSE